MTSRRAPSVLRIWRTRVYPFASSPMAHELIPPPLRQITEKLGWYLTPSRAEYDLAIYGAGPGGARALPSTAHRKGWRRCRWSVPRLAGKREAARGLRTILDFRKGSAAQHGRNGAREACRFGAEILVGREECAASSSRGKAQAIWRMATILVAKATICATGVEYRQLGLPNEDRLQRGPGVYTKPAPSVCSFAAPATMRTWWAAAIPPGKPCCISRATPPR